MKNKDTFSSYHPVINFLYFALVIGFSMFFMHPAALVISLLSSVIYLVNLNGAKAMLFCIKFALPVILITAIINPAFNHGGMTILCYLPSGNPLTLESILYGFAAASMLSAVLIWFRCYTEIMTADKFVYLFGRIIPALSLVLSMTLRFVPKFKAQFDVVREAQGCLGRDISKGNLWQRTKNAVTIFSIMITWSLENAIDSADSMKSRGYGLKGRTAFSIYNFDKRDKCMLLWLVFCVAFVLSGSIAGGLHWRYLPSVKGMLTQPFTIGFLIIYFALCLTPVIINWREERKWQSLKSKI